MAAIRKRIEEKRKGLYTDEEIREIAEHRLDAVLDAHEFNSDFVSDFRAEPARWNFLFGPETHLPQQPGRRGPGPRDASGASCGRSRSCSGTRTR